MGGLKIIRKIHSFYRMTDLAFKSLATFSSRHSFYSSYACT